MSLSSTGAPVTSTSPSPILRSAHAFFTAMAPSPSPSMEALPLSRTIIWAWLSSKNEDRSGLRMSPLLSWSSTSTHSGFDSERCSGVESRNGPRRSAVSAKSASRAFAPGEPGSSAANASLVADAAMEASGSHASSFVGSSGVRDSVFSLKVKVSRGLTTASTAGLSRISALAASIASAFFGIASSATEWPSSMVKSTSMIWPPKRSW